MMELIDAGKCICAAQIDAGKCIRAAQQVQGLSNAEFARLAGTSPQQIIRWRRNRNMKLHTMQRAAKVLGVTLITLISADYLNTDDN